MDHYQTLSSKYLTEVGILIMFALKQVIYLFKRAKGCRFFFFNIQNGLFANKRIQFQNIHDLLTKANDESAGCDNVSYLKFAAILPVMTSDIDVTSK